MGYTSCLSNRIEVQMLATMEEIPNGLAPLPWTICCEIKLHSLASSAGLELLGKSDLSMEMPPTVAVDHATTCEFPCTPNMSKCIESDAT